MLAGLGYVAFFGIKHDLIISNGDGDDMFLGSDDAQVGD